MKVKDLRAALKGLPANMDVVVDTGLTDARAENYSNIVLVVKKAKTKLIKRVGCYRLVQSRPKKDENATLSLVIE